MCIIFGYMKKQPSISSYIYIYICLPASNGNPIVHFIIIVIMCHYLYAVNAGLVIGLSIGISYFVLGVAHFGAFALILFIRHHCRRLKAKTCIAENGSSGEQSKAVALSNDVEMSPNVPTEQGAALPPTTALEVLTIVKLCT